MTRAEPCALALEPALSRADRVQSVVLGPGLGRDPQSAALVRRWLRAYRRRWWSMQTG